MRHQGKIIKWKDDQGFGFITPDRGGEHVFVHIKSFTNRQRRPAGNELVTYELGPDGKGRQQAERVTFVGDSPTTPTRSGMTSLTLPTLFLIVVAVSVVVGKLPLQVLGLYLVASLVAFLAYASDKSAAESGKWRTRENTLHLLAFIGGWPGAFFAQQLLRHKSKKRSFRIMFWTTVVLNCIAFVWLFTPDGAEALRFMLGHLPAPIGTGHRPFQE